MSGTNTLAIDQSTAKFLKALKANNNKEWFNANKKTYEEVIKKPAAFFCDQIVDELKALTGLDHKSKIFRIHRDLRFSKDKTPYNAHLHISFMPQQKESAPAWFFGLSPEQLTIGTGMFAFEKQQLDVFRRRINGSDGAALAKTLAMLTKKGARLSDPDLKKVPSGFDKDHPRETLLRHKGLAVWLDHSDVSKVLGAKTVPTSMKGFKQLKPVFEWLNDM